MKDYSAVATVFEGQIIAVATVPEGQSKAKGGNRTSLRWRRLESDKVRAEIDEETRDCFEGKKQNPQSGSHRVDSIEQKQRWTFG